MNLHALAIPFGGPLPGGRDLDGEFFDPDTDVGLTTASRVPVLWHHGRDLVLGETILGSATSWRKSDRGWTCDIDLVEDGAAYSYVTEVAKAAPLFCSVAALPELIRRASSGRIAQWPVLEVSLTTSPQNVLAVAIDRR